MGELITSWTIRLSLLLFTACIIAQLLGASKRWFSQWLWLWTLGFVLAVFHTIAAFHFYHDWSQQAAYQATAEQSRELIGVEFGAGLLFNYFFLAVWGWDVVQLARMGKSYLAVRWLRTLSIAYLVFIAFNGSVVFESGPVQLAGIAASVILLVAVVAKVIAAKSNRKESSIAE
jgi:hypothetical protein